MDVTRIHMKSKAIAVIMICAMSVLLGAQFVFPALADEITEPPTYDSKLLPFDPKEGQQIETTGSILSSISQVYLGSQDPLTVTIRIINIVLTFLGSAFLILLLYAGFQWVWARGNSEEIEKAKTLLKRALIGFVITLSAMGIALLVFVVTNTYTSSQLPSAIIPNVQ